ncbi:MAG TPA: hypothetical protein VGJ12_00180 [Gemmatimonadaceae bacterium]|jgi:hypothetical protein
MNDDLSSAWTFVYKFVFPALWIPLVGFGILTAFQHPGEVIYNGVKGAAPPFIGYELFAVWLAGSALILWFCMSLRRVRLTDDALLVSNYISEWRIPFAMIEGVSQDRWVNLRPITIRLCADVGCGRSVKFMPPLRWLLLFWREDPEVAELRRLAGLAKLPSS